MYVLHLMIYENILLRVNIYIFPIKVKGRERRNNTIKSSFFYGLNLKIKISFIEEKSDF